MDHIGAQCGQDLDVTKILPARLSAGRFVNSEIKPNCFLASPCVSDLPIWHIPGSIPKTWTVGGGREWRPGQGQR